MFEREIILLLISTVIKRSNSQYFHQKNGTDKSFMCEGTRDTKLVEHFFNLIFSEFHNTPPICTCVQMCTDQPAYCYPTGCMKTITKEPIHTHVQKEDKRVTLVITDRNVAFFSDWFQDPENIVTETSESAVERNSLPNAIKDRYRTLSQYKKTPKVELRYNFRQHINTRKSAMSKIENAVATKVRWPNRQSILLNKHKAAKFSSSKFISHSLQ